MRIDRKVWLKRIPAVLFVVAASYLLLRSYVYRAPRHIDVAALQLQQLNGRALPSAAVSGKAVVLNFWAPWCPPCRMEMPWLADLQKTHPEAAVVGIEDDDSALEQARELDGREHFSYPLVAANDRVRESFGNLAGLPTTLYISPGGTVVHTVTGMVPESVMKLYLRDTEAAH
jgi:thiol-disulfide isomerase/thioredoxin